MLIINSSPATMNGMLFKAEGNFETPPKNRRTISPAYTRQISEEYGNDYRAKI